MPVIGVAVAVPEPWARELQDYRTSIGDLTASRIPTHLTLVPPTEVDPGGVADVERHLTDAARGTEPFRIHLRGTGSFRPVSPVVFVAVVSGIVECEALANAVRTGPLASDLAFPFHPHVTIAHHLDEATLDRAHAELAGFECEFAADEFHLYAHDEAAGWRPTRSFSLGRPGTQQRGGRS